MLNRFYLAFPLILVACGDQEVKPGETGDTGATQSYLLTVDVDGQSADVDIATLATVDFGGDALVPATAVLDASGLTVTWSERTFDFLASDGYRPSDKTDCVPVDYTTLQGGYFYPESGELVWDESLGLFGCYNVKGTVAIEVQPVAR